MDSNCNRLYYVNMRNERNDKKRCAKGNTGEGERKRGERISRLVMQYKPPLGCYPGLPKAEEKKNL